MSTCVCPSQCASVCAHACSTVHPDISLCSPPPPPPHVCVCVCGKGGGGGYTCVCAYMHVIVHVTHNDTEQGCGTRGGGGGGGGDGPTVLMLHNNTKWVKCIKLETSHWCSTGSQTRAQRASYPAINTGQQLLQQFLF